MTLIGFAVMTGLIVALAGPMPTVITAILVLVLSGIVLYHSTQISAFLASVVFPSGATATKTTTTP